LEQPRRQTFDRRRHLDLERRPSRPALLASPDEQRRRPVWIVEQCEAVEDARVAAARPDRDVLVLDRAGAEAVLVDEVAQRQRHVALLAAADADVPHASPVAAAERLEAELEVRVIP